MSNPNNIWEVVSIKDIVQIIQNNRNKFIVIAIARDDSDSTEQKLLKNFLKNKHKDYPNIYFIYFALTKKDMGRISLFVKDETQYPLVYHIYNEEIFVKVNRANQKTLYESFDQVKEYYDKDKIKFLNKGNTNSDDNNSDNNSDDNLDNDSNDIDNINDIDNVDNVDNVDDDINVSEDKHPQNKQPKVSTNTHNNQMNNQTNNLQQNQQTNQQGNQQGNQQINQQTFEQQMIEQKKLFDKVILMQKHAREFNVEFLRDIQQRKKEEYEQKVKDREAQREEENKPKRKTKK